MNRVSAILRIANWFQSAIGGRNMEGIDQSSWDAFWFQSAIGGRNLGLFTEARRREHKFQSAIDYGLAHRSLEDVTQIGVDEIAVFKGHKYLTMVYQLDAGFRRLLWCGPERRAKTLLRFFRMFGKERSAKLRFICSDMWAPYLKVIAKKAPHALNVLDRFHIMKKFVRSH